MCKLEYLSQPVIKSSTQIHTICASLNTYHIFCVKVAHKFTQYEKTWTLLNHLGLKLYSILRCFSRNLRSWQKNLCDRRSCQISTLYCHPLCTVSMFYVDWNIHWQWAWQKEKVKGLATKCKAKTFTEGQVRFGCNLGQMIAYICRL